MRIQHDDVSDAMVRGRCYAYANSLQTDSAAQEVQKSQKLYISFSLPIEKGKLAS